MTFQRKKACLRGNIQRTEAPGNSHTMGLEDTAVGRHVMETGYTLEVEAKALFRDRRKPESDDLR